MGGFSIRSSGVWVQNEPERAREVTIQFASLLNSACFAGWCKRLDHMERLRAEFIGENPTEVLVVHGDGRPATGLRAADLPGDQRIFPISDMPNPMVDDLVDWFREIHFRQGLITLAPPEEIRARRRRRVEQFRQRGWPMPPEWLE